MSVSLSITRADGTFDEVAIGTFSAVQDGWEPLARSLGLELIPLFSGPLWLRPDTLNQLLSELAVFRPAVVERCGEQNTDVERVDRLISTLHELRGSEGWKAIIG